MSSIELRNVSVAIGDSTLVTPLDLHVESGTWVSIIGPNGAGKSTLLRAIVGAAECDGTVLIGGDPMSSLGRSERARRIAWVPQIPTIPPGMRVIDYVLLGRTPHRRALAAERPEDLAVAHDVLADLDLVGFADRAVSTLSGGERQRVIIGRALAQEAPTLLLDEPTTALDLGHQQDVLALLDGLRASGRTIVTTMHDLTLAGQFADRLLLLSNGTVVADGTAPHVLTEQNLARHYDADVQVMHDDGVVLVIPRITRHTKEPS